MDAHEQEDAAQDKFDRIAGQRGWAGHARDHTRFSKILVHCSEQSHRSDAASISEKWKTQRRSERMETAAHSVRTGDQCDGARIHEEVPGDSQSEDNVRREQRDPDAGRSGTEVRRALRQEIRERLEVTETVRHTSQSNRVTVGARGQISETNSKQLDPDEFDRTSGQRLGDDGKWWRQ